MRITEIREKTASIASAIANAYIDFSRMTCSVVAVMTDVIRDGKPIVGYGFNSNGRYGQGSLIRERFLPRILEADSKRLMDEKSDNLDPTRIWECMRYGNGAPDPKVFVYAGGFPDGVKVQDGYVTMPELPGIGFEGKADLYREMKALSN
jgi:hypothetical protein